MQFPASGDFYDNVAGFLDLVGARLEVALRLFMKILFVTFLPVQKSNQKRTVLTMLQPALKKTRKSKKVVRRLTET